MYTLFSKRITPQLDEYRFGFFAYLHTTSCHSGIGFDDRLLNGDAHNSYYMFFH